MKFVLVNKYDEIVSRVDLGEVGVNGAKTYFKGMKKMPEDKDFDKLWKVMTEKEYDNQFKEVEKFFDTMPKLSHTVKVINPNTKKENEVVLEGLQNFFG